MIAVITSILLQGNHEHADYIVTGAWSSKAAEEAAKYIKVKKVFTPAKPYVTVPDQEKWVHDEKAAYLYYCANETVHGIEFTPKAPESHKVPLVADVSSNFMARPFDFKDVRGLFPSQPIVRGACGYLLFSAWSGVRWSSEKLGSCRSDDCNRSEGSYRKGDSEIKQSFETLQRFQQQGITPAVFSYKEMIANNSLYNTPPTGGYIRSLSIRTIRYFQYLHDKPRA